MARAPLPGQLDRASLASAPLLHRKHVAEPARLGDDRGELRHGLVVERRARIDEAPGLGLERSTMTRGEWPRQFTAQPWTKSRYRLSSASQIQEPRPSTITIDGRAATFITRLTSVLMCALMCGSSMIYGVIGRGGAPGSGPAHRAERQAEPGAPRGGRWQRRGWRRRSCRRRDRAGTPSSAPLDGPAHGVGAAGGVLTRRARPPPEPPHHLGQDTVEGVGAARGLCHVRLGGRRVTGRRPRQAELPEIARQGGLGHREAASEQERPELFWERTVPPRRAGGSPSAAAARRQNDYS